MHEISFQAVNDRPTPYPPVAALGKSVAHFARPSGPNLLRRTDRLFQWVESRRQANVWPYVRSLDSAPAATASIRSEAGDPGGGINLASQDYLGLSSHPQVHAAAIESLSLIHISEPTRPY